MHVDLADLQGPPSEWPERRALSESESKAKVLRRYQSNDSCSMMLSSPLAPDECECSLCCFLSVTGICLFSGLVSRFSPVMWICFSLHLFHASHRQCVIICFSPVMCYTCFMLFASHADLLVRYTYFMLLVSHVDLLVHYTCSMLLAIHVELFVRYTCFVLLASHVDLFVHYTCFVLLASHVDLFICYNCFMLLASHVELFVHYNCFMLLVSHVDLFVRYTCFMILRTLPTPNHLSMSLMN